MKKYLLFAIAFIVFTVISCESDDSLSSTTQTFPEIKTTEQLLKAYKDTIKALGWEDRESFFKKMRYMSMADRKEADLLPTLTRSGDDLSPIDPGPQPLPELRIKFNIEWGLNYHGYCFGYSVPCKISFELSNDISGLEVSFIADEGLVETDPLGNKYIELLFTDDPETGANTPAMIVSEDIEGDIYVPSELINNIPEGMPTGLILPQGEYRYNSTLGLHGGYQINLIEFY